MKIIIIEEKAYERKINRRMAWKAVFCYAFATLLGVLFVGALAFTFYALMQVW